MFSLLLREFGVRRPMFARELTTTFTFMSDNLRRKLLPLA